jgi:dihydroorotase
VRLVDDAWTVPASYPLGGEQLVPLRAGAQIGWRLA